MLRLTRMIHNTSIAMFGNQAVNTIPYQTYSRSYQMLHVRRRIWNKSPQRNGAVLLLQDTKITVNKVVNNQIIVVSVRGERGQNVSHATSPTPVCQIIYRILTADIRASALKWIRILNEIRLPPLHQLRWSTLTRGIKVLNVIPTWETKHSHPVNPGVIRWC